MRNVKIGDSVTVGNGLTLLGGPCVAESLEMCKRICGYLQELCADLDIQYVFKASFDKANRSSVKSPRGPGIDAGLELLSEIKSSFNVPVVTDIHESYQAAKCAEVADLLQIPAFLCRQTDLLVAAAQTGKPVNIKKGQFMAAEDMAGAVNKVREAGSEDIMLTERGTSFGYHNLVVDMRGLATMREMGVPVIFDATHSVQLPGGLGNASGGQRQFIRPLSRAAAAVGIDALFTEVHPVPDEALSDGPNSLDFEQVKTVLQEVKQIYDLTR
ncbi:MAG: 3-deoxy-8-phosphooctulonate synthase [Lentisphaerae bacterium]|nr:3-deoxy-8-phosphooctulonate synthase [Lentisphaerota bacterium]MCP4102296.1 3-deoxy-8-phosphooctulonate synthase [Lentisphaerota bacterium]